MSSREKFFQDLETGKAGELVVARTLKKFFGAKSFTRQGADKTYDFILTFPDGTKEKFEVKTDLRAAKTGNLFFEYSCSDKPSGLASTKSERWGILVPHLKIIMVFCPAKMLMYLEGSSHRNLRGGDRRAVCGYVVPIIDLYEKTFVKIVHLTK